MDGYCRAKMKLKLVARCSVMLAEKRRESARQQVTSPHAESDRLRALIEKDHRLRALTGRTSVDDGAGGALVVKPPPGRYHHNPIKFDQFARAV